MTDVSLIHTSGGLLGDVFTDSLRAEAVDHTNRVLADIATFTAADGQAPRRTQYDADLNAAFTTGSALWTSYAEELADHMDVSRVREKLLIPFLRSLGFEPTYQRARLAAGGDTWGISHLGWSGAAGVDTPPLLLVAADDLDNRAGKPRSPHEELQGYLNNTPVRWGIVSNGRILRILRDYHHTRTRGYIEIDLVGIFDADSRPDFLALYRLAHASRYRNIIDASSADATGDADDSEEGGAVLPDAGGELGTLLEKAYAANLNTGIAAGKRLQPQVRMAIESFANGLLDSTPGLRQKLMDDPDLGRAFYREILTVLYRVLFLMLAEQRGMMSAAATLYGQTYSLTALRERVEAGDYEPRRNDLWAGLLTTFSLFTDPQRADLLSLYPYNGQLFDPTLTPITSAGSCSNVHTADAISALTTVEVGKLRMHVDYRNLGVEELGTVYESLLDYTLAIAATPVGVPGERRTVPAGRMYLAPLSTDRADLGAYYTRGDLVDLLLSRSLDPVIEQRLAAAGPDREAQEAALLSLTVLDPACGSAAILIGALDRIALALARVRSAPLEPRDHDLALARRDVLAHCIYGIDKDPFAVELAKVALWIHCVVPDQPLSFLDSRIVCGDALVGWPLLELPDTIPSDAFEFNRASKADKAILNRAKTINTRYIEAAKETDDTLFAVTVTPDLVLPAELAGDDTTYQAVRDKANAYNTWTASDEFTRWKAAADLWTAAFFWTADHGPAPTTSDYQDAIKGTPDTELASRAAAILADLNPLHWALMFPDVRARGGFDMIVGNPPWEESASIEQEFFAQAAPGIAAMTSEHRGQAIADLADANPRLHARWVTYRASQERSSHYAKTCGRYTRTGGKVNTYVQFTELAAEHAEYAGVIVKTGIATDAAQSDVWKRLTGNHRVVEIRDMQNMSPTGIPVFPSVTRDERFSALILGPEDSGRPLQASMMNFGIEQAAEGETRAWTSGDLAAAAPRTHTLLSTRRKDEIELALELQRKFPTLDFANGEGDNPWGISYHTLFNSTYVKTDGHALRPDALVKEGYVLGSDKVFRHPSGRTAVPLLEGQMVNRWDHRARTYEGYTGQNKYMRKPHIPWVTEEQHGDPNFENEPRYWMVTAHADERITDVAGDKWLLAMRDIGRAYSEKRNMRTALVGRYPATDTLPVLAAAPERAFAALALLNSMTFDFLLRIHMPGGHAKPWIVSQCAAPFPSDIPRGAGELAAKLSVTSERLTQLTGREVEVWNGPNREIWDAQIDALVALAYGLDRASYEIVLDHFQPLRRAEGKPPPRGFGEYRSKRLRLEAFDEIVGGTP